MNPTEEEKGGVELAVLASGSAGNACLLKVDGFGLLIDAGLGPRKLVSLFRKVGAGWPDIDAMILTHTHGDHWNDRVLERLSRLGIPFYCHREHRPALSRSGNGFAQLRSANLLRYYREEEPLQFTGGLVCRAVPVKHDSGATFGFRFERRQSLFDAPWAMGYASDLGCWDDSVAEAFANVDVLALEFNHDEEMQKTSRRPWQLIERVLSDEGHLSNHQAAKLTAEILNRSAPNRLQSLVQLHLSRDCNRPHLARESAETVLSDLSHPCEIHTASQFEPLILRDQRPEFRSQGKTGERGALAP
jgi:phosphoribosyl 1,2-cyclic phosphodiesterase